MSRRCDRKVQATNICDLRDTSLTGHSESSCRNQLHINTESPMVVRRCWLLYMPGRMRRSHVYIHQHHNMPKEEGRLTTCSGSFELFNEASCPSISFRYLSPPRATLSFSVLTPDDEHPNPSCVPVECCFNAGSSAVLSPRSKQTCFLWFGRGI